MPESNAAKTRRLQKNNRLNGIGDEHGRLVRVKDPPKLLKCTICQHELKVTKTNTELTQHALSRHNITDIEQCFPTATALAQEMIDALLSTKGGSAKAGASTTTSAGAGATAKASKKASSGLDDLLNAGLTGGSIKKKPIVASK